MVKPEAAIVDVCFAVFLFLDELCVEISAGKRLDSHNVFDNLSHNIIMCPFCNFFKICNDCHFERNCANFTKQMLCPVIQNHGRQCNSLNLDNSIIGFIATTVLNESGKHILNESAGKEKRNMWVKQCSGRKQWRTEREMDGSRKDGQRDTSKVKRMFLYSAVSSPLDRSKRFTLSSPGRPVHSDTNSASL